MWEDCPAPRDTVAFAVVFHGAKPFGPAGALRHYLDHAGWELDLHDNVKGPDHLQCNIPCDSARGIVNLLRSMWVQNIIGLLDRRGVGEHYLTHVWL